MDNHYRYDGNGNRTEKRQLLGITRYAYDALKRLSRVEYPDYTEELFYDQAGNRVRRVVKEGAGARRRAWEETYCYDSRNRLTERRGEGGTEHYTYDEAGNLLRDGRATYTYDAFHRTVKVETFHGEIQINRYDAEGLRAEMEENGQLVQFIYRDREIVVEERAEEKVRYIRADQLLASDAQHAKTWYHYASDELGSITHVEQKGQVLNRYEYDAWGNLTASEEQIENRFKFTGQQLDPISQQYYLRARYYNPVIGRFTQEDTYYEDGLNLYAYCRNNPVYYVDPSGNFCDNAAERICRLIDEGRIKGQNRAKLERYLRENAGNLTDAEKRVAERLGIKDESNNSDRQSETNIARPGDVNFVGPIQDGSWRLTPDGEGAHLIERSNVRGRPALSIYNQSSTPRYYPIGTPESAGQAHIRLHQATRNEGIRLRGGNPDMSDVQLLDNYSRAYSNPELSGIRGDLRTPDNLVVIARNVSPAEAYRALIEWGQNQQL